MLGWLASFGILARFAGCAAALDKSGQHSRVVGFLDLKRVITRHHDMPDATLVEILVADEVSPESVYCPVIDVECLTLKAQHLRHTGVEWLEPVFAVQEVQVEVLIDADDVVDVVERQRIDRLLDVLRTSQRRVDA